MTVFEKYCREFACLLGQLIERNADYAGMFMERLRVTENLQEKHLLITYISYCANSKVMRDTDDPHIHEICRQLIDLKKIFTAVSTIDLFPENIMQALRWRMALRLAKLQYAFKKEGCLRVGVLFCELKESKRLMLGRIWGDCGNFDGEGTDVVLPVTARQAQQVIAAKNGLLSDS
jgi:hypothetical protein